MSEGWTYVMPPAPALGCSPAMAGGPPAPGQSHSAHGQLVPQHRISIAGNEAGGLSPSSGPDACCTHNAASAHAHAHTLTRGYDSNPPTTRCPRSRLASHRLQVAGHVDIPDAWCGEARLREWASSEAVEAALRPPDLGSARAALVSTSRRASSPWAC